MNREFLVGSIHYNITIAVSPSDHRTNKQTVYLIEGILTFFLVSKPNKPLPHFYNRHTGPISLIQKRQSNGFKMGSKCYLARLFSGRHLPNLALSLSSQIKFVRGQEA